MATPLQYSNHWILLLSLKEAQTLLRRNHCFKSVCLHFRFPFGHISIVAASFNSMHTYSKCEAPFGSLALPAPLGIAGSLNQLQFKGCVGSLCLCKFCWWMLKTQSPLTIRAFGQKVGQLDKGRWTNTVDIVPAVSVAWQLVCQHSLAVPLLPYIFFRCHKAYGAWNPPVTVY